MRKVTIPILLAVIILLGGSLLYVITKEKGTDPQQTTVSQEETRKQDSNKGVDEQKEKQEDNKETNKTEEKPKEKTEELATRQNPILGEESLKYTDIFYKGGNNYEIRADLAVMEAFRGQEAWEFIKMANGFNEPPPTGYEYVLLYVVFELLDSATEDYSYSISEYDFRMLTESGEVVSLPSLVVANPFGGEIYNGGLLKGYMPVQVKIGESYLIVHETAKGKRHFFNPYIDPSKLKGE